MSARRATDTTLDLAIDALLAQRGHLHALDEDVLLATARLLRDGLPRFHPRFGFEEHLARRLAVTEDQAQAAPSEHGELVVLPSPDPSAASTDRAARRRRSLLAGGAIASGVSVAIPIAGAALVAWRRARTSGGVL